MPDDHIMRFSTDELTRIRFALESHLLRSGQSIESDPGWTVPYRDLLARIVGQLTGTERRKSDLPIWIGPAITDEQVSEPHRRRLSDLFRKATAERPVPRPPLPGPALPAPFDFIREKPDGNIAPGTRVRIPMPNRFGAQSGTVVSGPHGGNGYYMVSVSGIRDSRALYPNEFEIER